MVKISEGKKGGGHFFLEAIERLNITEEFVQEGVGWGWVLIRGWALNNFFCLKDGGLFEEGANSRLGAYSNKYGKFETQCITNIIFMFFFFAL